MYEIPYWHPLLVHFPIALIMAAAAFSLGWLIWGTSFWRLAMILLLAGGLAGAFAAKITGEELEDASKGRPVVKQLVHDHEETAERTLVSTAITLVVLAGYSFLRRAKGASLKDALLIRIIGCLMVLFCAGGVGYTGHLGGQMTWGVEKNSAASQIQSKTQGHP